MKNSAKSPLLPEMIQREARNLQEGPHPTTLAPGLWHPAPETATSSHRGHERGKSCVQSWPSERCSEMPSFRRTEDKSIQQGTLTERTLEQPQAAHDEVQGARNGSLLPTASKEPRPSASSHLSKPSQNRLSRLSQAFRRQQPQLTSWLQHHKRPPELSHPAKQHFNSWPKNLWDNVSCIKKKKKKFS